jgi:hypothetical protein
MKRAPGWLVWTAIVGNGLLAAWVLYNAVNEGFRGTMPQIVSGLGLIVLLALDSFLLWRLMRVSR